MFQKPTVFILGAGASWHYGYPTGEDLVKEVIEKAKVCKAFFEHASQNENYNRHPPDIVLDYIRNPELYVSSRHQGLVKAITWNFALEQCNKFISCIQAANPLVIDYFLGHNPSLQTFGKMLIAWVILEKEATSRGVDYNPNRLAQAKEENKDIRLYKDDWLRFITHQLVHRCKTQKDFEEKNDIKFITFNYDVSLEYTLLNSLSSIEFLKDFDLEKFINERIIHVYGKIRKDYNNVDFSVLDIDLRSFLVLSSVEDREKQKEFQRQLNLAYRSINLIHTISPFEKGLDEQSVQQACGALVPAEVVYILGYGFDEQNSDLLELQHTLNVNTKNRKRVFFTNYHDSNRVSKAVARIVKLIPEEIDYFCQNPTYNITPLTYFEKSTRNVYEAIEKDFDSFESVAG